MPFALADERAAVAAHVQEGAEAALLVAHDDDRHPAEIAGEERPRLGHLVGAAGVLPRAPEDPLPLEPQHGGVGVPVERDRAAVGKRCHRLDCSWAPRAAQKPGDEPDLG